MSHPVRDVRRGAFWIAILFHLADAGEFRDYFVELTHPCADELRRICAGLLMGLRGDERRAGASLPAWRATGEGWPRRLRLGPAALRSLARHR